MNRAELELGIAAACRVTRQREVLVIGSQAILGSYPEQDLPSRATMSMEADIAPLRDDSAETLATLIDAELGEWSDFDREHGFYVQGVSVRTAYLPDGWMDRVVRVEAGGGSVGVGLCLERHDLCAAKLARLEAKDVEFVSALLDAGLADARTVVTRITQITDPRFEPARKAASLRWARARVMSAES